MKYDKSIIEEILKEEFEKKKGSRKRGRQNCVAVCHYRLGCFCLSPPLLFVVSAAHVGATRVLVAHTTARIPAVGRLP